MTGVPACALMRKFTGKERDTESGLDYFGARHDASSLGRFMMPNCSNGCTLVLLRRPATAESVRLRQK